VCADWAAALISL